VNTTTTSHQPLFPVTDTYEVIANAIVGSQRSEKQADKRTIDYLDSVKLIDPNRAVILLLAPTSKPYIFECAKIGWYVSR